MCYNSVTESSRLFFSSCLFLQAHLHCDLRELLFGEVQWVVDGGDSVFIQVGTFGQVCPEDAVVGHVHEGNHGVPALVVVPHLQWETDRQLGSLPKWRTTVKQL